MVNLISLVVNFNPSDSITQKSNVNKNFLGSSLESWTCMNKSCAMSSKRIILSVPRESPKLHLLVGYAENEGYISNLSSHIQLNLFYIQTFY